MKKLLFLIFAGLIWCNVGFAKTFFYSCIHEDQFQMIFKVDDRLKKIIHVSSYVVWIMRSMLMLKRDT